MIVTQFHHERIETKKTVCIKTKRKQRKLKGWIDVVLTLFKQKLARGGRAHGLEVRDRHGKNVNISINNFLP